MSKSNKSSVKRKAAEPIAECMTTRSKQAKKKYTVNSASPTISVELNKKFKGIKLDSDTKQRSTGKKRSASKDSAVKYQDSDKKSRGRSSKNESTPETDNEEAGDQEEIDEDEDINVYNPKLESLSKAVRSSTRRRKSNLVYSEDYVCDNESRRTRSACKLNRSLISELEEVKTETKRRSKPITSSLNTASTVKQNKKQAVKTKDESNQNSKKRPVTSKSILNRIEEKSEDGSGSNEFSEKEDLQSDEVIEAGELEIRIELEEDENEKKKNKKKEISKVSKKEKITQPKPEQPEIIEKFDNAILQLQEYTLPNEIPCRETEKETIKSFINEGLESKGLCHCLYISGVPGIGKTVSVLEVIKQIQKEHENTESEFNFIHVNGLGLPNPENAYQIILRSIANITDMSNSSACVMLNNLFQKGALPKSFKQHKDELDQRVRLVLFDELDYLITKDQNLLYNLFDWPHSKHSKLIVIGIANTMNLPEQLLPKITSRMGNRRLVYKPYTSSQIEKILLSRIEGMDIIKPDAITFLSKKIATFSSDIRRTLHVCREAFKLCREEIIKESNNENKKSTEKGLLTMEHVRASYSSAYSSPYHQCIQTLMENSKLLLLAICLDMKNKGSATVNLAEVQDRLKGMMNNLGRRPLHHAETKQIFNQLVSLGLVTGKSKSLIKSSSGRIANIVDTQLCLKISLDDITNALKDDELSNKYTDLF